MNSRLPPSEEFKNRDFVDGIWGYLRKHLRSLGLVVVYLRGSSGPMRALKPNLDLSDPMARPDIDHVKITSGL